MTIQTQYWKYLHDEGNTSILVRGTWVLRVEHNGENYTWTAHKRLPGGGMSSTKGGGYAATDGEAQDKAMDWADSVL